MFRKTVSALFVVAILASVFVFVPKVQAAGKAYDYELVEQSPYPSVLKTGDSALVSLEIKNTGTQIWSSHGNSDIVRLGSGSQYGSSNQKRDYASEFAYDEWLSPNRPAQMQGVTVTPGSIATFIFKIKAPSVPGIYKAYFTPVVDGVTWMKDIGIYWQLTVVAGSNPDTAKSINLGNGEIVSANIGDEIKFVAPLNYYTGGPGYSSAILSYDGQPHPLCTNGGCDWAMYIFKVIGKGYATIDINGYQGFVNVGNYPVPEKPVINISEINDKQIVFAQTGSRISIDLPYSWGYATPQFDSSILRQEIPLTATDGGIPTCVTPSSVKSSRVTTSCVIAASNSYYFTAISKGFTYIKIAGPNSNGKVFTVGILVDHQEISYLYDTDNGAAKNAFDGSIFVITLQGHGDGGYQFLPPVYTSSALKLWGKAEYMSENPAPGSSSKTQWVFEVVHSNVLSSVEIKEARPWNGETLTPWKARFVGNQRPY